MSWFWLILDQNSKFVKRLDAGKTGRFTSIGKRLFLKKETEAIPDLPNILNILQTFVVYWPKPQNLS